MAKNVKESLTLELTIPDEFMQRKCGGCGKIDHGKHFKKCERCESIYYCRRKCQRKHWKKHKKSCRSMKVVKVSNRRWDEGKKVKWDYEKVMQLYAKTFNLTAAELEEYAI